MAHVWPGFKKSSQNFSGTFVCDLRTLGMMTQGWPQGTKVGAAPSAESEGIAWHRPMDAGCWFGYVRPWLMVAGVAVFAKVAITFGFPQAFADADQEALLRWPVLSLFVLAGLAGAALSARTGFAPAAPRTRAAKLLGAAFLTGITFGLLMILLDRATHFSEALAANHGVNQQYTGFIPMFLVFVLAAPAIVEVVYRLFPLPLLMWLTSNVMLRGRGQERAFWMLAVVLSALEPFTQTPDLRVLPATVWMADASLQYALNLAQAAFFRHHGFIAPVVVRAGFYLVWHVFYVH
jgi:hypothetical protein